MLLQERLAFVSFEGITAVAPGESIENHAAPLANPLRSPQQRWRPEVQHPHEQVGVAGQFLEAVVRNLPAKIIAGYVLHLMGFIKNHRRIFREDAAEVVLL